MTFVFSAPELCFPGLCCWDVVGKELRAQRGEWSEAGGSLGSPAEVPKLWAALLLLALMGS